MLSINAANLKALRQKKGWSLDELAARSHVDRGTISRIETGKQAGKRRTTIERLTNALETDVETLTGADISHTGRDLEGTARSQLNIRMENSARNALTLVAARYGIKPSHVLHIAPLLFLWAAEESLRQRQASLDTLSAELDAIQQPSSLNHLNGNVAWNWRGEEVMEQERRSIAKRDLFGLEIDGEALRPDYDEYEQNPMAQFIRQLCSSLGDLAHFDFWWPSSEPNFWLGEEEASALVNGDEEAVHQIVVGHAPLHELPKSVRDGGPDQVALWAKERGEAALADLYPGLTLNLGGDNEL